MAELNGIPQQLYIEGPSRHAPVLVFVHGGPGYSLAPYCREYVTRLRQDFLVVHWDQRGTHRSFQPKLDPASLTIDGIVSDLNALRAHLTRRFGARRIGLSGHSWGSFIATRYSYKHPNHVRFVVNAGQIVDLRLNEKVIATSLHALAERGGNRRALRDLDRIGPAPHLRLKDVVVLRHWSGFYRGAAKAFTSKEAFDAAVTKNAPRFYREHGFPEKAYRSANLRVVQSLWAKTMADPTCLRPEAPPPVPFYVAQGVDDLHTPFAPVEDYFSRRPLRRARLVPFFLSAHWPQLEEPEKFVALIHQAHRTARR